MSKHLLKTLSISTFIVLFTCLFSNYVFATSTNDFELEGKFYELEEKDKYEISEELEYSSTNGKLFINGNLANVQSADNLKTFNLSDGDLTIGYKIDDNLLNTNEEDWHVVDDDSNKIYGIKRDAKINNGAILIQTSIDGINWTDDTYIPNVFDDSTINNNELYSTNELQHLNGCYYRITVVYKLSKKEAPNKVLFVELEDYSYKKVIEVYEFHLNPQNENTSTESTQTHSLGNKMKVESSDGYYGEKEIKKDDIHYGWNLGHFYVSGFTAKTNENSENITFLKNVGDEVTLWFGLEQNINQLNNNEKLSITADKEGFSQDFETSRMDFGKGTMIIQHTDYQGIKSEPQIYTNYLEANTTLGADTKVQNFEEGDYDVVLLYEVSENKFLGDENHYKIQFSFSIRNGNCMVYPFDLESKEELATSSISESGFYLDLAKSRYLQINVKKEVLSEGADGLVEDTRFNKPAADGEKYTDEGIYTITATNPYTKQLTTKKIYVGTNNILKAYMQTGLSIPEINDLIADGCEVTSKGEIIQTSTEEVEKPIDIPDESFDESKDDLIKENSETETDDEQQSEIVNSDVKNNTSLIIIISTVVVLMVIVSVIISIKKKKRKLPTDIKNNGGLDE